MITYRKVGGLHWFGVGRLRISWCLVRAQRGEPDVNLPKVHPLIVRKPARLRLEDCRAKPKIKIDRVLAEEDYEYILEAGIADALRKRYGVPTLF